MGLENNGRQVLVVRGIECHLENHGRPPVRHEGRCLCALVAVEFAGTVYRSAGCSLTLLPRALVGYCRAAVRE